MPIIRLTAFFRDDDGHGWSESHDKNGGDGSPTLSGFLNAFDDLMKSFRQPLLAGDAYYLGCRASYPTDGGQQAGSNLFQDPPVQGQQTSGGVAVYTNQTPNAVKLRMKNAADTASSDVYLRGVWDAVFIGGVLNFLSAQGMAWKSSLDAYVERLRLDAYGWQGLNPALTSRGDVTNYASNINGTVTLTVAPTNGVILPITVPPAKRTVNFSRINDSQSILNRSLVCTVDSATTLTTIRRVAVSDFESEGTYILVGKGFTPYDHYGYVRQSSRKTGRPFGVGPGRLSARALH